MKYKVQSLKFKGLAALVGVGLFLSSTSGVFAHAVVKPNTAGVASFTDFSLGVPSERAVATTTVKLMLPPGLNNVLPIVKPGWKIDVKTSTTSAQPDDDGNLKPVPVEIDWTGGAVPAGQKDFFMFSAQVPAKEGELAWKVVQIYADSSTVSWNLGLNDPQPKDASGKSDFSASGPYSKTMVVNDLKASPSVGSNAPIKMGVQASDQNSWPLIISMVALFLAVGAIGLQLFKKASTNSIGS